jgi:hypothetical protein
LAHRSLPTAWLEWDHWNPICRIDRLLCWLMRGIFGKTGEQREGLCWCADFSSWRRGLWRHVLSLRWWWRASRLLTWWRENHMTSINFHLEEQGQEGRSCKYSTLLVAGSCTVIFYVVMLYVTYL